MRFHVSSGLMVWCFFQAILLLWVVPLTSLASTTTYVHDELGRLKTATRENGAQITYTYDPAGNRQAITSTAATGALQLSAATYSIAENGGSLTVTVSRVGGTSGPSSVSYSTTAGTAAAGSDYTTASGTLNWADGDNASKTFSIPIADDTAIEGSENFAIALSGNTGAILGSPDSATITVTDFEPGQIQFSPVTYTVGENGGGVTITATRTNGTDGAVGVNYAVTAGTATAGGDFTATSGTLSWSNGDSAAKTFTVSILDDAVVESSETVNLALSAATGGATLGASSGTITVTDYEPGQIQLSPTSYSVLEGNTTVTVSVTRANGSAGAVGVSYSASAGTATVGGDFVATSGTLSWADGDAATKTFIVTIKDDTSGESTETVNLALSGATGGASLGSSSGTITISDNESGSFVVWPTDYSVGEGAGTVATTVTRVNGSYGTVTVDYATANGSATAGSDFVTTSGTLSWANGDASSRIVNIPIIDDANVDPSESFDLVLSNATGGPSQPSSVGHITIVDNEAAVPTTPTGLFKSATPYSNRNYSIVWSASTGPLSYYQLAEDVDPFSSPGTDSTYQVNPPATSQLFSKPNTYREFNYRVRACNSGNQCSPWSAQIATVVCPSTGCP